MQEATRPGAGLVFPALALGLSTIFFSFWFPTAGLLTAVLTVGFALIARGAAGSRRDYRILANVAIGLVVIAVMVFFVLVTFRGSTTGSGSGVANLPT